MDNPYVSAAEGGLSAAAHFASSLQSAVTQKNAQDEAKRRQTLAEQLDMARLLNEGWQEYQPSQNVQQQGSGLKTRDYQPPPSSLVTLPHIGKQLYRPDQTDKEKRAGAQQGYSDLRTALNEGFQQPSAEGNVDQYPTTPRYQMDEQGRTTDTGMFGTHVAPPADWQKLQVPGGPSVYKPGPAEQQYDKSRGEIVKEQRQEDAKGYALPDGVAAKLEEHAGLAPGTLRGISVPKTEMHAFIKDLMDKKPAPHVVTSGYSSPLVIDPATSTSTAVQLPPGVKPSLTPGQEESKTRFQERQDDRRDARAQREEDKAQTSRNSAQSAIDKLQEKEQGLHALRSEWGNALATPAGDGGKDPVVIDPETKREVTLNPARRKYYEQKIKDAGDKVGSLQDAQKKLVGRNGGNSGGQQGKGKLTDTNVASQYLQKAGGDKAKARALAKADGWEF